MRAPLKRALPGRFVRVRGGPVTCYIVVADGAPIPAGFRRVEDRESAHLVRGARVNGERRR